MLLKEQFHSLRTDENIKLSNHLSVLNVIVDELKTIRVKIYDEDKTSRFIWSISSSYENINSILIYRKEHLSFEEVSTKVISEERRLKSEDNSSSNLALVVRGKSYVKKKYWNECEILEMWKDWACKL